MSWRTGIIISTAALCLLPWAGCTTTSGGGGWVVPGQPAKAPPPPTAPPPPKRRVENRGQERAAQNHIRSAYRFLEKGKPDHAIRELEKARGKTGRTFWLHYYMGGALYMKGMHREAEESWRMAFRHTNDPRLRSRLKTCESFAVNRVDGDGASSALLRTALDLDRSNTVASDLLAELGTTGYAAQPDRDGKKSEKGTWKMGAKETPAPSEGPRRKDSRAGKPDERGRKQARGKKIRDSESFRAYFLIEMP